MKRVFLLISFLILCFSCMKNGYGDTASQGAGSDISFKVLSKTITKGAELDGAILPNTYGIYAAATQKTVAGEIENPVFFSGTEQLFATAEADPASGPDNRFWHASPQKVYWPLGGVRMDYLAYAEKQSLHQPVIATEAAKPALDAGGNWAAFWDNYLNDSASKLSFNGVNTYAYQNDVLFAARNGQTSAENGGASNSVKMEFEHAQALLLFNIKNNFASAAEATDAGIVVDEIMFLTPERVQAMLDYQVYVAGLLDPASAEPLAALKNSDVTLKTVGTFTVDNEHNNLTAAWSFAPVNDTADKGCTRAASYRMPDFGASPAVSAANCAGNKTPLAVATQKYGQPLAFVTGGSYAQLGETLLIPEQNKVNFTVKYHFNGTPGKYYYYTFNDLRGVWQMGHKYVYSIDLTVNQIVITENVFDYEYVEAIPSEPEPESDPANGHAYVDLGLRSGGNKILFATMNIGASSPEEYGDYFAWGETSKRYTNISGNSVVGGSFELSNCPYHTGDTYNTGWSKYIPTGFESYTVSGTADNLLTLEASDDVASALWGGSWRMPTAEELCMLINGDGTSTDYNETDNVTYSWTNDYNGTGVHGYIITGKGSFSSASLFLPAAGYCYDTDLDGAGDYGIYFSRSVNSNDPEQAWDLYFAEFDQEDMNFNIRYAGQSVRPVLVLPE